MNIDPIGGDEYSGYSYFPTFDAGGDGERIDQILQRILEREGTDGYGSSLPSEFKIAEDFLLKADSNQDGVVDQTELKDSLTEKVEQLKKLMSGFEYMQAAMPSEPEKDESASSLLDMFKVEIPGNGIDDDNDGYIDEDDTMSLLDILDEDDQDEENGVGNLFDLLM